VPVDTEVEIYDVAPGGPVTVSGNEVVALNGCATPVALEMSTDGVATVVKSRLTLVSVPRLESNRLYVNPSDTGVEADGMLNVCVIVVAREAADIANRPTANPAIANGFLIVSMCSTFLL
jgi:hypothetical protein